MSIIEEFERNLQFEQQYISSVVEGMDEMHIICPICRMWVQEMAAITHDAAKVSPKLQTYGDLRLQAYVTSSVCRARFTQGFNVVYNHRASCVFAGTTWASTAILSRARAGCTLTPRFVCSTPSLFEMRDTLEHFFWDFWKKNPTHIHPAYK